MASLQHPVAVSLCAIKDADATRLKANRNLARLRLDSFPTIELPSVSVGRKVFVQADRFGQDVATRASKCPFGFQSPTRKEGKDSSTTEAASTAMRSPAPGSAPYAPAPSSFPEARNLGPGTFEYLPLKVPYQMTMGLKPMRPEDWIEIDIFYDEEMAIRRELLETRKEVGVATHPAYPQAIEANWEVLELLVEYLPKRFPTRFTVAEGETIIHNVSTGEVFDISDRSLDPLEISSRLVQEDLCLLMKVDGVLRFVSGAVLFPNRWQFMEKLGMDMRNIHLPVPLYEEIGAKVSAFTDRLKVGKPVWRANWTIDADPTLHAPLNEEDIYAALQGRITELDDQITVSTAGTRLFTRCERQTLMRLPRTGAILFTIRTYVKPLSVFESRTALAAQFVKALKCLPESIFNYKSMAGFHRLAVEYLRNCANPQA